MSDLLPCPFCGGVDAEVAGAESWEHGKLISRYSHVVCPCGGMTDQFGTEEEAVSVWNSRQPPYSPSQSVTVNINVLRGDR